MEPTRKLTEKEQHTLDEIKMYAAQLEEAKMHLDNAIRTCTNATATGYLKGVDVDLKKIDVGLHKAILNITL